MYVLLIESPHLNHRDCKMFCVRMNDFTKNIAQALFNQDKINDLLRQEIERVVNDLLEAELTTFLGYDPYARSSWNSGNSRNCAYYRKIDTQFGEIEIQVPRDRNIKHF